MYASGVKNATKKGVKAPAAAKRARPANKAEVVRDLIGKVEKKLTSTGGVKASIGDYIRLMQLQKDLQDEDVTHIEVKWIEREPDSGE